MTTQVEKKVTMKDLKAVDPRWCTGCGDYTILVGIRKLMVQQQMDPSNTVNISGIGCSGRIPHYMNTYGFHTVHGRTVPVATAVSLLRPDLNLFMESGDGDSMSIGGNHLLHGISKNFNCVYLMFDNQIYGLTKQQTSPTTRKGLVTQTAPGGNMLDPINPIRFALGLGASFVASTAEWMGQHMVDTLEAAINHDGFSFDHIAQRCPKFNPTAWNYQNSDWLTFIENENAVAADLKAAPDAKRATHNPSDLQAAFKHSENVPNTFGLFYREAKPTYDGLMRDLVENTPKKDPSKILDSFLI